MKLSYLDLCGFRGYRKRIRIEFADRFTIIDGRNGVGKSTIFDAVEFALTGTIGKYGGAKAAGESVADYLWWKGEGPRPEDYFVEVGFRDSDEEISIRRTQFGDIDGDVLAELSNRLCDRSLAPQSPLSQLCASSIIRDPESARKPLRRTSHDHRPHRPQTEQERPGVPHRLLRRAPRRASDAVALRARPPRCLTPTRSRSSGSTGSDVVVRRFGPDRRA